MNQLLILVTRMYARRGESGDEFTEVWGGKTEDEYLLFPPQPAGQTRLVLIVHGYDYPTSANAEAVARAEAAVDDALRLLFDKHDLGHPQVGVAFHSRQSWRSVEIDSFAQKLWEGLKKKGHDVRVVREYGHELLARCNSATEFKSGKDFSAAFDKFWADLFAGQARLDKRLVNIRHDLVTKLSPLNNRLRDWVGAGFDAELGLNIVKHHGGAKTRSTLSEVRSYVDGDTWHGDSVKKIVDTASLYLGDAPEAQPIRAAYDKVMGMFGDGNADYQKVKNIATLLESPTEAQAAQGDTRLGQLRSQLEGGNNPFGAWYALLLSSLDDLRKALRETLAGRS